MVPTSYSVGGNEFNRTGWLACSWCSRWAPLVLGSRLLLPWDLGSSCPGIWAPLVLGSGLLLSWDPGSSCPGIWAPPALGTGLLLPWDLGSSCPGIWAPPVLGSGLLLSWDLGSPCPGIWAPLALGSGLLLSWDLGSSCPGILPRRDQTAASPTPYQLRHPASLYLHSSAHRDDWGVSSGVARASLSKLPG